MNRFKIAVEAKECTDLSSMLALIFISSFNMVTFLDRLIGKDVVSGLIINMHPNFYKIMNFVYSLLGMLALIFITTIIGTIFNFILKFFLENSEKLVDNGIKKVFITLFGFRFAATCDIIFELIFYSEYSPYSKIEGAQAETIRMGLRIAAVVLILVGIFIVCPVLEFLKGGYSEADYLTANMDSPNRKMTDMEKHSEKYEKKRAYAIKKSNFSAEGKARLLEENRLYWENYRRELASRKEKEKK